MPQRWTDHQTDQLRALHTQEGMTLGLAAKAIGFAPATVSRWSAKLGISWERSAAMNVAIEAKRMDAAAHLSAYALEAAEVARHLVAQIRQKATYYELGRVEKDMDSWFDRTQDEPTAQDKRSLAQAAATSATTAAKILDRDTAREAGSDLDAWLDYMAPEGGG